MFDSSVGFSGTADLMAQLLNVKNPRWWLTAILHIQQEAQLLLGDRATRKHAKDS